MKTAGFGRYALSAGAAVALLAGCGGSQLAVGAPSPFADATQLRTSGTPSAAMAKSAQPRRSSRRSVDEAAPPLLYITNFNPVYGGVTVYHARARDRSPIETITNGLFQPTGDCIDGEGTLYVTNDPGSSLGWVSVYPAGKTTPSRVITDGVNIPAFCVIDGHGNLWVTNLGGKDVAKYKAGSSKPSTLITNGVPNPVGIAIDRAGDMYVSNGSAGSQLNVVVYAPGGKSPKTTITDGVQNPVGIAVDSGGTLYVTNFLENNVEKYLPGKRHPYETVTSGISEPSAVTVGKNGWLYVTNDGAPAPAVVEFPPGSLMPSSRTITKGLKTPEGSAYYPPLLP